MSMNLLASSGGAGVNGAGASGQPASLFALSAQASSANGMAVDGAGNSLLNGASPTVDFASLLQGKREEIAPVPVASNAPSFSLSVSGGMSGGTALNALALASGMMGDATIGGGDIRDFTLPASPNAGVPAAPEGIEIMAMASSSIAVSTLPMSEEGEPEQAKSEDEAENIGVAQSDAESADRLSSVADANEGAQPVAAFAPIAPVITAAPVAAAPASDVPASGTERVSADAVPAGSGGAGSRTAVLRTAGMEGESEGTISSSLFSAVPTASVMRDKAVTSDRVQEPAEPVPATSVIADDAPSRPVAAAVKPGEATALLASLRAAFPSVEPAVDAPEGTIMTGDSAAHALSRQHQGASSLAESLTGALSAGALSASPSSLSAQATKGEQPDIGVVVTLSSGTDSDGAGAGDSASYGEGGQSAAPSSSIPSVASSTAPSGAFSVALNNASGLSSPVAAALNQQVIDLGVSGQWIDDIAREIASISANPGQGSFRIASPHLGGVKVDLMPGTHGTDIRMTVESELAHAALQKDQSRLLQDAELAALRIGDVRIERAPASDTTRNESHANGQHQGQATAQAGAGQHQGQGNSSARQDMAGTNDGNSGQNNAKTPFTKTVMKEVGDGDAGANLRSGRGGDARYA
ncbi:MAG: hypothetical protein E2598_12860 [Sphingobium sp.]|nr:hypothetical protein [Sphingobium sp.]